MRFPSAIRDEKISRTWQNVIPFKAIRARHSLPIHSTESSTAESLPFCQGTSWFFCHLVFQHWPERPPSAFPPRPVPDQPIYSQRYPLRNLFSSFLFCTVESQRTESRYKVTRSAQEDRMPPMLPDPDGISEDLTGAAAALTITAAPKNRTAETNQSFSFTAVRPGGGSCPRCLTTALKIRNNGSDER